MLREANAWPQVIGSWSSFPWYTDITELTPELLRLFIQKIVVHEKSEKWSKHTPQTMEIHYTDIGCVGSECAETKELRQVS